MQGRSYEVQLEVFHGPLDLLLHLIEHNHLDITTVSLAQVTDQYLAYLRLLEERRPDEIADFVVIAARLLLIKSRALLPQPPPLIQEEEDVGEDLVRQLREYRRFKHVADTLRQRDQDSLHSYPRTIPATRFLNLVPKLDLESTSLDDLIEALRGLLQEAQADDGLAVIPLKVTIGQKIQEIDELLHTRQSLTFDDLIEGKTSRLEVIVTLLAVLELIRSRRVQAQQSALFGPISITPLETSAQQPASGNDRSEETEET
jgi:segregation and condensation protein A